MILLIYLLKVVSCSALFCAYYFFMLRNKRMHQYNRIYILASVALSIVLPLINIPMVSSGNEPQAINKTLQGLAFGGWEKEVVITAKQSFVHSIITERNIIMSLYIAGLLVTIYPVVRSLIYIRALSQRHQVVQLGSIQFYDTAEPGTPFSFFNTVFWNTSIATDTEEGQQILRHELYHIKQKHSYDILLMQFACSLFWFNPFCYLLNKELKVIHEFLADEYAASGTDKHEYAKMLVMQAMSPKQVFITNQFFYNQIKRRITMILQSNNTRYGIIRKMMTVPIALLIFCACSVKNKDEVVSSDRKTVDVVLDKVYVKPEVESTYPGGPQGWLRFLNKNFRYPQEAQEQEIQGTVILEFKVEKDGSVTNIKTVEPIPTDRKGSMAGIVVAALSKDKKIIQVQATKGQSELLKNEAVRVLMQSGKWVPATNNGVAVASMKKQPITFKLEAE